MFGGIDLVLVDETLPTRPEVINDPAAPPWGMLSYDRGALSAAQQANLNRLKTPVIRKGSRRYLSSHPQVTALVSVILRAVYLSRPKDPKKFIARFVERSDFEDEVRRCVLKGGIVRRSKGDLGKDLFECINPELLVERQSKVSTEREVVCLDSPDEWKIENSGIEYPDDLASSVDTLEAFTALGSKAEYLDSRMDELYQWRDDLAREAVETYLNAKKKEVEENGEKQDDLPVKPTKKCNLRAHLS
ncbi:uncharacterized protein LOC124160488 [Ischnura elegans]|uniref:uncharacterized protein LOC124160488 n=1 Tax=Ischnura elegans TaxID=197161 RepID=UPI001ED8B3CD|nr:uncharacterized protein LOC124160488 [Ischnura elegans]